MSNTSAIVRFVISAVMCAAIIFLTAYGSIFYTAETIPTVSQDSVSTYENTVVNETVDTKATSSENVSSETPSPESAVAASTNATVQGKVVEKFISPYTANTSYNNVYLKNSTGLDINIKNLLGASLGYKIEKSDQPQVLILHTHATESFLKESRDYYTTDDQSRTTDESYNMIALGKIVADKLNAAGITTLHDTTLHDYPSYNESYSRAADTICSYTEKYPSIKIVIDMHRDAIAANDTDKVKITTEIDGKKAAQVMLVMGSQSGNVTNFPDWQENLKLAVKMQQTFEVMYPTLARSIHFVSKNYNESLTTGSVLLEIGTDGNTLDEVKYSAELVGNALVNLMNNIS